MPRSANFSNATPREVASAISRSRRDFLRQATGAMLLAPSALRALTSTSSKKAVVVTFGGGARDDETFHPDGKDNIPHMIAELAPRSTFFTQVINRGILG